MMTRKASPLPGIFLNALLNQRDRLPQRRLDGLLCWPPAGGPSAPIRVHVPRKTARVQRIVRPLLRLTRKFGLIT